MLLRSSISNTMKFLQKTLENFKSCFSPSYQKLPKTPPNNQFSYSVPATGVIGMNNNNPSYKDLEKFYSDFTQQWDTEKEKGKRRSKKKSVLSSAPEKPQKEDYKESFNNLNNAKIQMEKKNEECENQKNKRRLNHQRVRQQDSSLNCMRGNKNCMVEKKLREMEMLEKSNVDYVLDIEEVLHYYSRLTCPLYLEIVDKFFMEMYSEFFGDHAKPATPTVNSSLKLRSVRS
ncbi:hypothetical protein VNO77_00251 [Canavalia gladiata]|uniref:OVATE domain-containing protein n=1 Tax=Canavalia gladiata TaxID=3824 RepID=A0AAN9R550_CANGL